MADAAAVHMHQRRRDLGERLHQPGELELDGLVDGFAVDVFDEQMDLADAEKPIALHFESVNLDEIDVVEHLADPEFQLGLVAVFAVIHVGDRDNLERELAIVAMAADMVDRTVRALAKLRENLEFADGFRHARLPVRRLPLGARTIAHTSAKRQAAKRIYGPIILLWIDPAFSMCL